MSGYAAHGPRRLLVATYALFALAALGRSSVQIAGSWHEARLAYALSAVAAALSRPGRAWRRLVVCGCAVELAGVLAVGALSLTAGNLFPDATVWSDFGMGYGFVPLVLPIAGLAWALRSRSAPRVSPTHS